MPVKVIQAATDSSHQNLLCGVKIHLLRECGMDPDHSDFMTEYGLKPGDRPGTDLYPKIWQRF